MNPFRYSGPIVREDPESGVSFVARTTICQTILKHIQQGNYEQIVGPHQSGRTTLAIDLIGKLLPKPETIAPYIPVLISCESLMDACREGFINTTVARLRRVMNEYLIEEKHSKLRGILAEPIPKTLLDFHEFLITCGDELRQSTEFSGIVIFMDEIEALPDNLVVDVLRFFRALFHHYAERRWESPYRVIILATHDLSYWQLGKSSPYNVSYVVPLKPFSRKDIDTILDDNHAGKVLKNITFDDSSRDRIFQESGGYPYFIQQLCHIMVERHLHENNPIILSSKDVMQGVMELFEKGDKNLQSLYREATAASDEWQLLKRLSAGLREPFEADDPAISTLTELGIISNVNHYCRISTCLYERQILKRYFQEEFSQVEESLAEKERLLLHIPCLQKILLNAKIRQFAFSRLEDYARRKSDNLNHDKIAAELSDCLEKWLSEKGVYLDMEEIYAYVDYYNIGEVADSSEIIELMSKAFVARFISA